MTDQSTGELINQASTALAQLSGRMRGDDRPLLLRPADREAVTRVRDFLRRWREWVDHE